jgi:hypothetical protein
MARFDPLRTVAIDVVFRSLDRPDHIGLLHASGFQAHILCHFLDIIKIHMAPPKSWIKGDSTPDLALLKNHPKRIRRQGWSSATKIFTETFSLHVVF